MERFGLFGMACVIILGATPALVKRASGQLADVQNAACEDVTCQSCLSGMINTPDDPDCQKTCCVIIGTEETSFKSCEFQSEGFPNCRVTYDGPTVMCEDADVYLCTGPKACAFLSPIGDGSYWCKTNSEDCDCSGLGPNDGTTTANGKTGCATPP